MLFGFPLISSAHATTYGTAQSAITVAAAASFATSVDHPFFQQETLDRSDVVAHNQCTTPKQDPIQPSSPCVCVSHLYRLKRINCTRW